MYIWADWESVFVIFTTTGGQELICLPGDTEINTRQSAGASGRAVYLNTHTPKPAKESARVRESYWHLHTCGGGELLCVCVCFLSLPLTLFNFYCCCTSSAEMLSLSRVCVTLFLPSTSPSHALISVFFL